jgi:PPK2 family polyphosphate:nucleotide phosphotransferase
VRFPASARLLWRLVQYETRLAIGGFWIWAHIPRLYQTTPNNSVYNQQRRRYHCGHAMKIDKLLKRYRVEQGKHFSLKHHDPADTHGLESNSKQQAQDLLAGGVEELGRLQDILAAQDRWALLLIFQGMDAAGKDGTIKHVMSGINPEGVHVWSFKQPSEEELHHGFLWRETKRMPERGQIAIFNRSYYEEVLVVRVHSQVLEDEKLPKPLVTKHIWQERFEDINNFERYATRNGIAVIKFFLHLSKKEQKNRFMERLDTPEKNWKFSSADIREREFWDAYQDAYEDAIRHTASKHAPWYVVPADNKWFTRLVVSHAVVDTLKAMNLKYPKVSGTEKSALAQGRKQLENE